MPFCLNIKQKLRQQQLQQRLQEAAMMRRRMAQMNARMRPDGMNTTSGGGKGGPVSSAPSQPSMSGGAGGMNHMASSGKPGGSAQPNQNVLEAVKKVINLLSMYYSIMITVRFRKKPSSNLFH